MDNDLADILQRYDIQLVPDTTGEQYGDQVTDRPLSRDRAKQAVTDLEAIGAEADWAPDQEDRHMAWVYVRIKNPHAVALGRRGGQARSAAKTQAVRENAKKGGWPKGKPRKPSQEPIQ